MAGGIDWFRWHHGSTSDPKFQLVAKKAGASVAEVIAVWACILEAASQSAQRGSYGELDFEALDCSLGLADGKAKDIHDRMQERALVDGGCKVTAWEKRQPKREDDTAADRKRRQRERDAQNIPPSPTPSRDVTQGHDRGEESREEKEDSVAKATGAAAPDAIWENGLTYLVGSGIAEKGARSFLGKMRQALNNDLLVAELLTKAQTQQVSDPLAWLRAAAGRKTNAGRTKAGVAL